MSNQVRKAILNRSYAMPYTIADTNKIGLMKVVIQSREYNEDFFKHFPLGSMFGKKELLKAKLLSKHLTNPYLVTRLEHMVKVYGEVQITT